MLNYILYYILKILQIRFCRLATFYHRHNRTIGRLLMTIAHKALVKGQRYLMSRWNPISPMSISPLWMPAEQIIFSISDPIAHYLLHIKDFFQEWRIIGILLEYEAIKLWPYTEEGNRRPQNQGKCWETTKSKNKPIKELTFGWVGVCLSWPTISTIAWLWGNAHIKDFASCGAADHFWVDHTGGIRRTSFGKN